MGLLEDRPAELACRELRMARDRAAEPLLGILFTGSISRLRDPVREQDRGIPFVQPDGPGFVVRAGKHPQGKA